MRELLDLIDNDEANIYYLDGYGHEFSFNAALYSLYQDKKDWNVELVTYPADLPTFWSIMEE